MSGVEYSRVVGFLQQAVLSILERDGQSGLPEITEATRLFGSGGVLSSLLLVELMLEVEDFCSANGRQFNWTDDATMSERRSVYRTVGSLADFILSLPPIEPDGD